MATTAAATPAFTITRLGGNDRYATAAVIATASFPAGAKTVVIATGENFPDALAGNYLAGQRGGPVLLTMAATVPAPTLTALMTLKAKNVLLLGGTGAISQAVENALNATASTNADGGNLVVQRLFGPTRYDTMREIAINPGAAAVGSIAGRRTAIIATGENFADAVSLGPVSWANKLPVILTQPDNLVAQASSTLTALGIQQVLIAGGPVAINASVETAINAMGVTTLQRFGGTDRSDTSRLAANYAIDTLGFKNSHFNIATGAPVLGGVDALAGGSHGGAEDPTVILLTNDTANPGAVLTFATARAATLTSAHAFGLDGALQQVMLDNITNAARGLVPNPGNFNVTPAGNLVRTNSSVGSGTPTDTQGDTTLTFTNLTGTVDEVLIPCAAYRPVLNKFSNSNNNLIADRTNLAGGPPIDISGTPAILGSVNGSTVGIIVPSDYANNVVIPASGTLTVVITNTFDLNPGADSPCVRVLVFNDVNNNDALDSTTEGPASAIEN
ncbi:MAG: cell wall-binding repeat-containing protein, partial [Acidimicrobiales bacterium]